MYDSIIFSFMSPERQAATIAMQQHANEYRLRTAKFVPWADDIKWTRELNIVGVTFKPTLLFNLPAVAHANPNEAQKGEYVDSPTGKWRYQHNCLRAGMPLQTWHGRQIGTVMFDSPVVTPAIYERNHEMSYKDVPWMSITPAEMLSLRCGTRRAKGRVVVAGLGLGYQLREVAKRKQVTDIVLVERDQELVDWLVPHIAPRIRQPLEVIVGDAYKVVPTLTADVALIDIFEGYGSNKYEVDRIRNESPNIKTVWGWGTADMGGW